LIHLFLCLNPLFYPLFFQSKEKFKFQLSM
jgi:hypothetical protein